MTTEPNPYIHHRRSIRLRDDDYSQAGAYFITICTHDRHYLFGNVANGAMRLNSYGETVREEWVRSAEIRGEIDLDVFVVMPNHMPGLVVSTRDVESARRRPSGEGRRHGPSPRSVASLVAGFKSAATKRINALRPGPRVAVWQHNDHEHIIGNEDDLAIIREYVDTNPARWAQDRYCSDSRGNGRPPVAPTRPMGDRR